MQILAREESRERCAEAGWYAYDLMLSEPLSETGIRQLKPLGSFVYLGMLKKPFFKVENHYFILKGILGDDFFRVAVHGDHREELERISTFVIEKL